VRIGDFELCCPACRSDLNESPAGDSTACAACGRTFPIIAGIPDLRVFSDPYVDFETDRAKAGFIAESFDDYDFPGLVAFYYRNTSVVPPQHAEQYTRGLIAGTARAAGALAAWERDEAAAPSSGPLLDLGCGTAPLLVAAAGRFRASVGVDIALRWLVVAKKRLEEAGLDAPLVCACAEALPFRDATFDNLAGESVIECVRDQAETAAEMYRVLCDGGCLFLSAPNRYSLGPDPHTGLWAGGMLPERWVDRHVARQGGIPPQRRLLSARMMRTLLREAGFASCRQKLPDVSPGQRDAQPPVVKRLVDLYGLAKRLPGARQALRLVGPSFYTLARKRGSA